MAKGFRIQDMSEAEFQTTVLEYAKTGGWLRTHFRPAKTQSGRWVTPISGDAGFPDLVLVHHELQRSLFVELKAEKKYLKPEQKVWRDGMIAAGLEWRLWRPSNLDEIKHELLGHRLHREVRWQ